jgi:single-strand DNA-binding protein
MDINNCVFAGRLTKDPELKFTPNGVAVVTITLAINRSFTNQQGEREADFANFTAFKGRAEAIANHFKKGDEIGIVSRFQSRNYENSEGKRVFINEFVVENFSFGQKKGGNTNPNTNTAGRSQNGNTGQTDPFANDGQPIDISDDDLPF